MYGWMASVCVCVCACVCRHQLHVDCWDRYFQSLIQRRQQGLPFEGTHRLRSPPDLTLPNAARSPRWFSPSICFDGVGSGYIDLDLGQFRCPMCRRISNGLCPIMPALDPPTPPVVLATSSLPHTVPADSMMQLGRQLAQWALLDGHPPPSPDNMTYGARRVDLRSVTGVVLT